MSAKPPTIHGLQADLRAANAEVEELMNRQRPLEQENEQLRSRVATMQWQIYIARLALKPEAT